jgi:hypothetical protein
MNIIVTAHGYYALEPSPRGTGFQAFGPDGALLGDIELPDVDYHFPHPDDMVFEPDYSPSGYLAS